MACTTVTMDIYWNAIATPLFLFVLANALFALFRMSLIQRASTSSVLSAIASVSRRSSDKLSP